MAKLMTKSEFAKALTDIFNEETKALDAEGKLAVLDGFANYFWRFNNLTPLARE